ncbi:beta-ketoacyl-ACP synthase III [Micromonospora sp. BQ11]|uniref:beta-ketoacyl-ACP synthase III n=1 Tax=Micromonospora sp. BQ11 TaxID=3452212 RepID=UPI003F8AB7B6
MTSAVVCGIGSYLPPRVVTNTELAARLGTSVEWIETRTGIHQRRVINAGGSTADLAVEAGIRAMKSAGLTRVDAVVLATTTPDHRCPGTAPAVASRLGLTGVPAMDVNAVCTGFLYAAASGAGLIATGVAERLLVIGADTYSTILNPADRTTTAIFGDGAGAVVLRRGEADEPGALGAFDLGSDGELAELIWIPAGGSRQRSTGATTPAEDHYFQMRGTAVFKHAVVRMAQAAGTATSRAGWRTEDVDRLVCHQANARILAALGTELGLAADRVVSNIASVGNTAAASIPLALADAARSGQLRAGHRVVLAAFGGGLTWGATTLVWPDITPV